MAPIEKADKAVNKMINDQDNNNIFDHIYKLVIKDLTELRYDTEQKRTKHSEVRLETC